MLSYRPVLTASATRPVACSMASQPSSALAGNKPSLHSSAALPSPLPDRSGTRRALLRQDHPAWQWMKWAAFEPPTPVPQPSTSARENIAPPEAAPLAASNDDTNGQKEAIAAATDTEQTHLVVLVHGLAGDHNDWSAFCREAASQGAMPHMLFHSSVANPRSRTLDGVDVCGGRLVEELRRIVGCSPSLSHISLVGHSMGGLISRYAVGKLYDPSTGTILGLKPAHFVTMATPHVGCIADGVSEVPLLGWAGEMPFIGGHLHKAMSAMAAPVSSLMFGRSGTQFFLEDVETEPSMDGPAMSLIEIMADDHPKHGAFISGLQAFATRTAYANVSGDHLVSWANSSLRFREELPSVQVFPRDKTVSIRTTSWDITDESMDVAAPAALEGDSSGGAAGPLGRNGGANQQQQQQQLRPSWSAPSLQDAGNKAASNAERVFRMLTKLQALNWNRVDVLIRDKVSPFLAHNHIQVTSKWINNVGLPITHHLISHLAEMEAGLPHHQHQVTPAVMNETERIEGIIRKHSVESSRDESRTSE